MYKERYLNSSSIDNKAAKFLLLSMNFWTLDTELLPGIRNKDVDLQYLRVSSSLSWEVRGGEHVTFLPTTSVYLKKSYWSILFNWATISDVERHKHKNMKKPVMISDSFCLMLNSRQSREGEVRTLLCCQHWLLRAVDWRSRGKRRAHEGSEPHK